MTSTQSTYVTAAHADSCIEIPFWTLWEDMRVLLFQGAELFLQERGENVEDYDLDGSTLRVALIPIASYVTQLKRDMANGHLDWDERGPRHVRQFIPVLRKGEYVPPIVVDKNGWWDGRHRMLAADKIGLVALPGIDYDEWLNGLVKKLKH